MATAYAPTGTHEMALPWAFARYAAVLPMPSWYAQLERSANRRTVPVSSTIAQVAAAFTPGAVRRAP